MSNWETEQCLIGGEDGVYRQVETALCVWEHVIEDTYDKRGPKIESALYAWITEGEGVYHGRMRCAEIAWLFDVAYEVGQGGDQLRLDGLAFDWEIVPAIFDAFVAMHDRPSEVDIETAKQVGEMLPSILKFKHGRD